jgi:hypothetical protein
MVKIDEIFGNKENIKIIIDHLKNKNEKCIILRGYIGSGKMTLIKACIEHLDYDCIMYDVDEENDDIDLVKKIKMSLTGNGMDKLFKLKPKAIVIKDIDNSLKHTQKNELYDFLKKVSYPITPLIITTNDTLVGTIREIPKELKQLEFEKPTLKDMLLLFSYSVLSKKKLTDIIENSKYDIRQIKFILSSIKNKNDKVLGVKDLELDTFNSINYCFDGSNSMSDKLNYCTIYTNYTMFHNYPKLSNNLKELSDIADFSASSDEIVSYIYKNNMWDNLYEISHILGTLGPVDIIGKKNYKKLEYPSSNIKDHEYNLNIFKNDISIILLINKFKNKSIDEKEYIKELININDPVKYFKLANIMKDKKSKEYKYNLNELKKYIMISN